MADVEVALRWAGDLRFEVGRPGGATVLVDGGSGAAVSPVELLLVSLASCMAADIVDIAQKMRVPFGMLTAHAAGERAAEVPRRYTKVLLRFVVEGAAAADEPKLLRALELSQEKYCSVLHSLRPDLPIEFSLARG